MQLFNIIISPLGLILVPVGLFLFFWSRRRLFWITVASIPFFFVVVFDLGFTLVKPFQFFGALLILRTVIDFASNRVNRGLTISPPGAAVLVFLFVSYLSLIMPVILGGSLYVMPAETRYQDYENVQLLTFSVKNLTQIAYPTFMIMLFLVLLKEIEDLGTIKRIIRLYVVMAFINMAAGAFYQVSLLSGRREPLERLYWFVTGHTDVSRIYYGAYYNMIGGIPRMFTFIGEPGYTSAYFLVVFAILVGLTFSVTSRGWRPRRGKIAALIVLSGLIMAGATTGYLGLALMVVMLFILPKLFKLGKGGQGLRATVNLAVILAVLMAVVTLTAPVLMETSFSDYVYSTHYAKIFEQEGSGAVRFATVVSGVEVFLDSPILGVGFGSHRTASLLTSLLSNVGLVGTLAFLFFNVLIVRRAVRVCRKSSEPQLISVCYALLIAFSTLFPVMLIAKGMVALAQGWYWIILAMIETCHRLYLQESTEDVDEAVSDAIPSPRATFHQPSIS